MPDKIPRDPVSIEHTFRIKGPLPLRRSTHSYCDNCGSPAEEYCQKDCSHCGIKNATWDSTGEIYQKLLKEMKH